AIGKASGFWGLHPRAEESQTGFLLNHLIREELPGEPSGAGTGTMSNSDPLTGQAGWYDVRVRIDPADAPPQQGGAPPSEAAQSWPQFDAPKPLPHKAPHQPQVRVLRYFAGRGKSKGAQP
ncbi:MAG: formate dehydrogenase, partial [Thiomonas sp.]